MGLNILKNKFIRNNLLVLTFMGTLSFSGIAMAAGTLTVTPNTGLVNGQKVTVMGSGLAKNSTGAILECNNATQPTVIIATGEPASPVSCTPIGGLVTTTSNGTLSSSFKIIQGVTGPPVSGTDSNHVSSATDAALFPCPPTAAQLAAGDSCSLSYGDVAGDEVSANITFASQSASTSTTTPAPTATTTPTSTSKTPTATSSTLVNTGPGNVIGLFAIVAAIAAASYYSYTYFSQRKI
jgi:hypothetical protein